MTRKWWQVLLGRPGGLVQDRAAPPPADPDAAAWAELAETMKFNQLTRVRGLSEQWRNSLIALTALVGVASLVKGPETAAELPDLPRFLVGLSLLLAFLLLLFGSVMSMFAAYGPLGPQQLITGERLRQWDTEQVQSARLQLLVAQVAMVLGLLLLGTAASLAYAASPVPDKPAATETTGR